MMKQRVRAHIKPTTGTVVGEYRRTPPMRKAYRDLAMLGIHRDTDGDGVSDQYDCAPLDPTQQGAVHDFFVDLLNKVKPRYKDPQAQVAIDAAISDVKKVETHGDLRDWFTKHALTLELTGLLAISALTLEFTGGTGFVQSAETGEIFFKNPTLFRELLHTSSIAFSGLAIGTGLAEDYVRARLNELAENFKKVVKT